MWKEHTAPGDDMLLSLSKHLSEIENSRLIKFPRLLGNNILISSDYSSGTDGSDFFVASFLMVDWSQIYKWNTLRQQIRSEHLSDGRRMSYKRLGDKKRSDALEGFLAAANEHTGILISFGIHKSVKWSFTNSGDANWARDELGLRSKWKPKTFEHLVRVSALVTFFSGGLLQDWQDITWITDDDDFTHDFTRREDAAKLLRFWRAVNHRSHTAEAIFQAVSLTPNRDMQFEDLCSIPDLVAGATAEFYTHVNRLAPLKPEAVPEERIIPDNVSEKANTIMEWYVKDSLRLGDSFV